MDHIDNHSYAQSHIRSGGISRSIGHSLTTAGGMAETTGESRTQRGHDTLLERLAELEVLLIRVLRHQATSERCAHCGAYQGDDRCPYCGSTLHLGQGHACTGPSMLHHSY
jgi:hypothetical protein